MNQDYHRINVEIFHIDYAKSSALVLTCLPHEQDEYLWCGSYWVTHGGGPSKAVEEWLDEEADEGKTIRDFRDVDDDCEGC